MAEHIRFITYGDEGYKIAVERIILQAKYTGFFDECLAETDLTITKDLDFKKALKENESFHKVFQHNRGGGYWLWKPYIIYKHLSQLNNGDLLCYSDAGCILSIKADNKREKTLEKLKSYSSQIRNSTQGILAIENPFIEKDFTKKEVFDFFGAYENKDIYNTHQFSGGRHLIRKSSFSMKFYKKWWDIARLHPELFSDETATTEHFSSFKAPRHDQSVWSLLCKTNKINECVDRFVNREDFKTKFPFRATRIKGGEVPKWLLDWAKQ